MPKRILFLILSVFCISMYTHSIDAWIRINKLGYMPFAQKKAVYISETPQILQQFSIHDALTNQELEVFSTISNHGEFEQFKSTYILDFSKFKMQGAFYIKAGLVYSPTIYINKNVYLGTADYLLNFIRSRRKKTDPQDTLAQKYTHYISTGEINTATEIITQAKPEKKNSRTKSSKNKTVEPQPVLPVLKNINGGWNDISTTIQYSDIAANSLFHLLFAYQMNPKSFADQYNTTGLKEPNGIPDILDEAKWGLEWLLKMYPDKDSLYVQINDDNKKSEYVFSAVNKITYKLDTTIMAQPIFLATGKSQGLFETKNQTNGLASLAGKFATAFALGASIYEKTDPIFAATLSSKAIEAYELGKKHPGICQSVPDKNGKYHSEANWSDDMELAATQLYRLTYEGSYLDDAANFGRMEPITPWLCSRSADDYQWYPFINFGHYHLANVENPKFKNEFTLNLKNGIERMSLYAHDNPFNVGVPFIENSNNLIAALATQCKLYRNISNDSSYIDMEDALTDWIFGRNPWGICMIDDLPGYGTKALSTQFTNTSDFNNKGALTKGALNKDLYKSITDDGLITLNNYSRFQSDWSVYKVNNEDNLTVQPSLGGTTALSYLLAGKQKDGVGEKTSDKNHYLYGGIVKTDSTKKQISLVFSGHEYADGYKSVRKTLKKLNIKASFFFTGDFYRKSRFKKVIKGLQKEGHYLGAQSDKHILYSSFQNRDSLLINKTQFLNDLLANYKAMEKFKIQKNESQFFIPSYEWYNDSISSWSREVGIQLIAPTPGTLSNMDNSIPEMRQNYFSSVEIFNRITQKEQKEGLNGNILLFHIGADKRRQDKFYNQLYSLIIELSKRGYDFVDLYKSTDVIDKTELDASDKKHKRKNQ